MKKILLPVITALVLTLAAGISAVPSFASEDTSENRTKIYEEIGLELTLPEEFDTLKGSLSMFEIGAISDDPNVFLLTAIYYGLPEEERAIVKNAPSTGDVDPDLLDKYNRSSIYCSCIFATDGDAETATDKADPIFTHSLAPIVRDSVTEIGAVNGYTYYCASLNPETDLEYVGEEFAGEYLKVQDLLIEAAKNANLLGPVNTSETMSGETLSFTAKDIDGGTITSEELFSGNKINVLNLWGTWCPSCVAEMGYLAELQTVLEKKGCSMIGVEREYKTDEEISAKARSIMEDAGTNYPNILLSDEMGALNTITGFPYFVFVDSKGSVVFWPNHSIPNDTIESVVDRLLAEMNEGAESAESGAAGSAESEAADPAESGSADSAENGAPGSAVNEAAKAETQNVHSVHVRDEDGPVKDVVVQFCDDAACRIGSTDENGVATFDVPEGVIYEIHILMVPEGYEQDATVYHTGEAYGDTVIMLKKQ